MKRILVVYYSQSGQLTEIVSSILDPIRESSDVEIVMEALRPVPPYPFPWPLYRFLNVFPESVLLEPPALEPLELDVDARYDLVILAYTVWYLAPSLPVTAFLKSQEASVLGGTPVITVVNARDKWLTAQEHVKAELKRLGAKWIDHVALVHQGNSFQRFVTTLRWMWTGKKAAFWRVFPRAGVADLDIREAVRFGRAIGEALQTGELSEDKSILAGLGAARVDDDMVILERAAGPSFRFWARLIRAVGRPGSMLRVPLLLLFGLYLSAMLVLGTPVLISYKLLFRRFVRVRMARLVARYEEPSGSRRKDGS